MKTTINFLFLFLFLTAQVIPQQYLERQFKGYTNPDELVTLSPNVSFNLAVSLISKVSESLTGKRVVSTVDSDAPIGIEITNLPYDKALVVLVQFHGLRYEEKEDVIIIKRKEDPAADDRKPETYASVDSREVKISALFFEMDVVESRKRGVDWSVILSNGPNTVGGELIGEPRGALTEIEPPDFKVNLSRDFRIGDFFGEATAMFKFFEEENLGEILASPNIIVRDRNKGRIQVGSDFAVKQRDFAGNIIETFFPTGTIIEVSPYVYREDNVDYVLLDILVERSSFILGEQTTEIRKTNATTQVIMLNGEEAVLGGLFINEETAIRTGIPFLKDLPWWFFGLRYIFGSDQTVVRKKELVILLKTELIPTLKERLTGVKPENILRDDIRENNERIKYYRLNQKSY